MPGPAQDAYLESKILAAEPLELVRLLYRAAGDSVRRARAHLAAGRIAERSREISRALAILSELTTGLDHARGGTLSRSLAELYDYLQRRLLEANLRQKAEPLAEAESLLATLLEAWEQIHPAGESPAALPGRPEPKPVHAGAAASCRPYAPAPLLAAEPALEYATQTWSF
jgi:flagellar protein FliS